MSGGGAPPILVDTSSLIAYCKTSYADLVFEELPMATTNVCNEEISRQRDASLDLIHQGACEQYYGLLRKNKNPSTIYIEPYKEYVEDQGEASLITAFKNNQEDIKYILLFDFPAIEQLESVKKQIGANNTKISLPNHAFELLRRNGVMTDEEYCKATAQMAAEEGWLKDHAARIGAVSPIDCPEL